MSLSEIFERGEGSVVIIDDSYLPPNPDSVRGDALAELLRSIQGSPENRISLGGLLNLPDAAPRDLVDSATESLPALFTAYLGGQHSYLQPLFSDLEEKQAADLRRVKLLEEEVSKFFSVTPKTFADLDSARQDLSTCSIAFVDFFLDGVSRHEDARQLYLAVKDELAEKFTCGSASYPKILVLMSSSLPPTAELAIFRKETGVRSAFFHTLDKGRFTSEELQARLRELAESYASANRLNNYLETVENQILAAAKDLKDEVRRLDLHDLTILKTLRLDGESDTTQAYLTLLLAEALAARVRMATPLQTEVLPSAQTYGDSPFDGKLLPSSILFELFADIAVAPAPINEQLKVGFGDVLEAVGGDDAEKLYLAISPACDLQRCGPAYEVLCVPGRIVEKNADLPNLLSKTYQFGKGHLVLKVITPGGVVSYSSISFDVKSLKTLPVAVIQDPLKFRRLARLTEVFAQEVKTLALNHAARVGVPVDPSFSIGLRATVRFSFTGDSKDAPRVEDCFEMDGSDFIPAVLSMGRELGDEELRRTIMFSAQFKEKLQSHLAQKLENQQSAKLKKVADHFSKSDSFKVALEKDKTSTTIRDTKATVILLEQPPEVGAFRDFEIVVYPF